MRKPAEVTAYAIGLVLIVSGIVHLGVFLADDVPWSGPVSWRKPATFGLSFGLTLITVAWITRPLILGDRARAWLLGVLTADCVVEVAGITLQAWRRVPSHFNTETPFDRGVAMILAAGGAVLVATLGAYAVTALRGRIRGPADMRLAVRAGFALMLVSLASGVAMVARGTVLFRTVSPQAAYDGGGFLKPVHGVALHAVLVLPLLAVVLRALGRDERERLRIVAVASVLYGVATAAALVVSVT
ncbi:hypothetical protein SAMN05421541_103582 [Actinoplanes philippinensis]|uniref:Uncharacterized protein n=1 Tax=Actinoplanes philippinensis TaxID=35752 RepID=A0A1I2DE41_9ACTN|nr:hypothetical protein [Actinoplanes philippinensis]SFE78865.1 hypothetical protein SAMN05421541_103582 [Actinoplanes philippinensis]